MAASHSFYIPLLRLCQQ